MYLDDDITPWLTVLLGADEAAKYAHVPNVMLFEMFPNLRYGPHGDELVAAFAKMDVIFRDGKLLPQTHTYSIANFILTLERTYQPFHNASYTNHRRFFGVDTEAPYIDRLAEGHLEHGDGRHPMVRLRLSELLPSAPEGLNPWHVTSLNVIANTILLQHWYAHKVHTHAQLRQLIPAHNRFCDTFGLPLLNDVPHL